MTKVSVIVPVYNVEKYLDRCVESIVNQTYSDIEIILVDDGSPDNCSQMCDEWAKKDNRIIVIHKKNGGLTSARISGFKIATCECVLFVDSDDYLELNMIEIMLNKMDENKADLVMCSYYQESEKGCREHRFNFSGILEGQDIVNNYILPLAQTGLRYTKVPGFMCIRLFKRELIDLDFFYDEKAVFTEDDVFNVLYALKCKSVYVVDKALYHYVYNSSSLSNTYREGKFEMWCNRARIIEKAFKDHNILISDTDLSFIYLPGVFSEINNSALRLDCIDYRKIIISMLQDEQIQGKMKFSYIKNLRKNYVFSYLLLKLKCYSLLYFVRKKRLGLK